MNEMVLAAVFASGFSVLVGLVEIPYRSKASLLNCVNGNFSLYILILIVGNTVTTLLAGASTASHFAPRAVSAVAGAEEGQEPSEEAPGPATDDARAPRTEDAPSLPDWSPLPWYFSAFVSAFLGVFGFEVVLQNMNVTFFDKGVLSINDWISKARDNAVASAIESRTRGGFNRAVRAAEKLRLLQPKDLNAHALNIIDVQMLSEVQQKATQAGADEALSIALALAYAAPDKVAAIIKN